MIIKYASITVKDQAKALSFYTNVLGFRKKADVANEGYRWLTVVSPEGIEGAELVLEPMGFPPAETYQKALFDAGIPAFMLVTTDFDAEYGRLKKLGVVFRGEPFVMGKIKSIPFEDTCGNLINLAQPAA